MKYYLVIYMAALIICNAGRAEDKKVTLKLANVTSQSTIEAGKLFKEIAERESDGSITVNLFDNNQLGDDRVVIEGTIFGEIDIGISATSPMATMYSDFFIFDSPYLFLSPAEAYAGLDGPVGRAMLDGMKEISLKGLAFWENGFRNLTNNKKPIRIPEEAKGMKIRTMENEIHLAAWKAMGTNPTPMAGTEVFTALQQGTIDAQENPFGVIDGSKYFEVQKYISCTEHVYTPFVVFMNLEKYNFLSEQQRAAIDMAAEESTAFQRRRSQEIEGELRVRFNKTGEVIDLTQNEKKQWQALIIQANIFDLVKKKMKNPAYLDEMIVK